MEEDKKRQIIILSIIGIIPIIWIALLIAPYSNDGISSIIKNNNQIFNNPFNIKICENSLDTVLFLLVIYIGGIVLYFSTRKNYRRNEVYEETLFHKSINVSISVEDEVENKLLSEDLKSAINELNDIQKRRIQKYFFENKTYEEIASEENCTKRAVKFSIDIAIEKISKKFNF